MVPEPNGYHKYTFVSSATVTLMMVIGITIAIVRDSGTCCYNLHVNGTAAGSGTSSGISCWANHCNNCNVEQMDYEGIHIVHGSDSARNYTGYMDEIRI